MTAATVKRSSAAWGGPWKRRALCYYYRGAYYRAFWRAPSACAVREPHAKYTGETRIPLIAQNLHRYFWYAALLVGTLLTYDVTQAFRGPGGNFGFGIGSLILLANVILLWGYTLGCHSCRHITAGRLKNWTDRRADPRRPGLATAIGDEELTL